MGRWFVFGGLSLLIGLAWVSGQEATDPSVSKAKVQKSLGTFFKATFGQIDPVAAEPEPYVKPSSTQLKKRLSRMQYDVTQNAATEPARRNIYWNNKKDGVYECVVCGQDLFNSATKYKSGTGWPSFYAPLNEDKIATTTDYELFYPRVEVHCSRCQAHLGHVFDDGPKPTGKRYCMNSASMNLVEKKKMSVGEMSQSK